MLLKQKQSLGHEELYTSFRKGMRNGNWRRLRFLDKALFRAAMGYAKRGRSIVNGLLVEKLLELAARLKETKGMRIFKRGFKRAVEMLEKGEEKGVFVWAPSLRDWLKDPEYIFWLGTNLFLNPFASKSLYGKTLRIRKALPTTFLPSVKTLTKNIPILFLSTGSFFRKKVFCKKEKVL